MDGWREAEKGVTATKRLSSTFSIMKQKEEKTWHLCAISLSPLHPYICNIPTILPEGMLYRQSTESKARVCTALKEKTEQRHH